MRLSALSFCLFAFVLSALNAPSHACEDGHCSADKPAESPRLLSFQMLENSDGSLAYAEPSTHEGQYFSLAHPDDPAPAIEADGNVTVPSFTFSNARSDSHAPIGVMADHTHKAGEWMISYRYMRMHMAGNRDGSTQVDADAVLVNYMVAPLRMTMQMHMFGAMYAPTDWVTLMVMLPYTEISMDHRRRDGVRFTTETAGIGDVKLAAMFPLPLEGHHRAHVTAGFSVPTGSIDKKDTLPAPVGRVRLPYPMQLGSGTVDFLPSATYTWQGEAWSFGGQLGATLRIGENDNDYTLGNKFDATGWASHQWQPEVSTSLRLAFSSWKDIDGADPALNPAMVPTADPDLRSGERLDLLVGLNLKPDQDWLKGHRIAIEFGVPIYQSLDGPQLETDWLLTAGWQYSF